MTYVSCKLACSTIFHADNLLIVDDCDNMLNQYLFDSTYFVEKSDSIVIHSFKFVQCDACGIVGYYENTRVHGTYIHIGLQSGMLGVCHQKYEITASGTSDVEAERRKVFPQVAFGEGHHRWEC